MKRRAFLGVGLGMAAGGTVLRGPRSATAQSAGPLLNELTVASAPGVTAREIRIGMSAAFKGTAAALGTEVHSGAQAYYSQVNARGGVHGRLIRVIALDDGGEPLPCVQNTVQLVEKEQVFFLSNYVGTPTLTRALPVIKRYADQQLLLVGNVSGAQPPREPPYAEQVFSMRASDRQEAAALVERFWQRGARKFAVFYQIDEAGRSGADGVARALARHGAHPVAEATHHRGARFDQDMRVAVSAVREGGAEVVLCAGAYQGCGAFVRSARDAGFTAPIASLSLVGADAMLRLLVAHGKGAGRDYTRALISSQVVPSYDDSQLAALAEYRTLVDRHRPVLPEGLRDATYEAEKHSFLGVEGFVNAKIIVEALRRAGPNPTRAGFKTALESLRSFDVGIGSPVELGPQRHQGLDGVYFTRVHGERWVPITDWSVALRA
jgi:ABC-type branched-subunit amino acid transport system substrate-binding protein